MDKPKNHNTTNGNAEFLYKERTDIDFIYKKCDAPRVLLTYWISVPEFFDEISRLQGTQTEINNEVVFNVMREIYNDKEQDRLNGIPTDFKFAPARRAIRVLSGIVLGDRDLWDK